MIETVMYNIVRADASCITCFGMAPAKEGDPPQRLGPTQNAEAPLLEGQPRAYFRRAKSDRIYTRVTAAADPDDPPDGGPQDLLTAATIWVIQSTRYDWLLQAARVIRKALFAAKAWNQNYTINPNPADPAETLDVYVSKMVLADEQDTDQQPFPGEALAPQERWLTFLSEFKEDV